MATTTTTSSPQLLHTQALALLRQHCSVLRGRLVFDASRDERGAHARQKWMSLLCVNVTASELRASLGFQLRVAIDIVNALCACRGFAPHRNGRFWRDAVSTLWIEYADSPRNVIDPRRPDFYLFQPPADYLRPFDEAALSFFTVAVEKYPPSELEPTLAELWRQVVGANGASQCPSALLESRDAVLALLGSYAVRATRTLTLELKIPDNLFRYPSFNTERPVPVSWSWRPLYAALRACDPVSRTSVMTRHRQTGRLGTPQLITISNRSDRSSWWRFALYTTNVRHVRQLVASSPLSIQCLTFDAVFEEDEDPSRLNDQLVLFGELLHTLLIERRSLKTLRLEGHCHAHLVAAVCSLLPVCSCAEELVLFDYDDEEEAPWLSYALYHPRRDPEELKRLHLQAAFFPGPPFDEHRMKALVASQQRGTPLETIARSAVFDARIEELGWFASGTTVACVQKQTAELFASPRCDSLVWKPMRKDSELEAVVTVKSMGAVGVVARGWGLCWVREGDVCLVAATETLQRKESPGIRRLCLSKLDWDYVVPLVRRVGGETLLELNLLVILINQVAGDELRLLLACCPNLESLRLGQCDVDRLAPLIDAYEAPTRPCRIASLSLATHGRGRTRRTAGLDRLFEMLTDPNHPGTRVLRHLSISLHDGKCELVRQAAQVLEANHTLETVLIDGNVERGWSYEQMATWTRGQLGKFQDQVLNDAKPCAIGLLSVISHSIRAGGAAGSLDALAVNAVMAFVGPTTIRTVRWLCGDASNFPSVWLCS